MHEKAKYYISKLKLIPHPEGGYYKELYRSGELISVEGLPARYKRSKSFSTSIFYLIEGKQVSKFHKIKSDEVWHFYDGSPVKIYTLTHNQSIEIRNLGNDIASGEIFQILINKNNWFAAELVNKNSFALIGCTVSPGFDFDDFQIAERDKLIKQYPQFADEIKKLT